MTPLKEKKEKKVTRDCLDINSARLTAAPQDKTLADTVTRLTLHGFHTPPCLRLGDLNPTVKDKPER